MMLRIAVVLVAVSAGSLLIRADRPAAPGSNSFITKLIETQSGHDGPEPTLPRFVATPEYTLKTTSDAPALQPLADDTSAVTALSPAAPQSETKAVTAKITRSLAEGIERSPAPAKIDTVAALSVPPRPQEPASEHNLLDVAAFGKTEADSTVLAAPAVIQPLISVEKEDTPDPEAAGQSNSEPDAKSGVNDKTKAKVAPKKVMPAKELFGAAKEPAPLASRAIGTYAKGCLSGGKALPIDGPTWQAMRLSRNRNWGHPELVKLVEQLANDAKEKDSWPGLLVGDLAQPRGGPMLTGHASHQIGLDADVWLTPMPNRRLSKREREDLAATSMLDQTSIAVDKNVFTDAQVKLIKRAASYPEVERVLVHPAIKKALCEASGTDKKWLVKVRPIFGHYYHMHIRIGCPKGSASCVTQAAVSGEDGCGKEVEEWIARVKPRPTPPQPPEPKPPVVAGTKPSVKTGLTLADLPSECRLVVEAPVKGGLLEKISQPQNLSPDDKGETPQITGPQGRTSKKVKALQKVSKRR